MRERGRYQIQLMKTRSSSGVGSKVDLEFDVDTLRISDCEQEDEGYKSAGNSNANSIVSALKRNSTSTSTDNSSDTVRQDPAEGDAAPKIRAQTDSTKLRDFLNNLGG